MGIIKDYLKGDMDNLRSLKYTEYSTLVKDPYIQKPFDFQYNQIKSRLTDVERFAKILTSKPGLKFQGNQALLQQVGALNDLKKSAKKPGGGFNFKGLLKEVGKKALNTAVNNVATTASIIAQVPVNGTGTHFIKGLTPSGYLQSGATRETGLGQFLADQGIGGGVNGAKSALNGDSVGVSQNGGGLKADSILFGNENQTLLSRQQVIAANKFASDFAGLADNVPSSLANFNPLGAGKVNPLQIGGFKLPDVGKSLLGVSKPPSIPNLSNDYTEYLGKEITQGTTAPAPTNISVQIARDRKKLENKLNSEGTVTAEVSNETIAPLKQTPNYKGKQINGNYLNDQLYIQTRLKLGDQGNKNATSNVDELNALAEQTETILGKDTKDIIPFEFHVLGVGAVADKFLYFRAHLDSLDDTYNGDWAGTRYIGRAEEFYTYQGFKRDINFSFKIAAFSRPELVPLYKKLNHLVGSTAPTYNQSGEFMRGTLTSITIGDYIYQQRGFISNIGLTWNTTYPWEINVDVGQEGLIARVPHILDVSVNFTPIHNFNVKSNVNLENNETYIGGNRMKEFKKPSVDVGLAQIDNNNSDVANPFSQQTTNLFNLGG